MWLSLSLRRRRDLSFNHRCFIGDASPEFNPTSVILCLSLKTQEERTTQETYEDDVMQLEYCHNLITQVHPNPVDNVE